MRSSISVICFEGHRNETCDNINFSIKLCASNMTYFRSFHFVRSRDFSEKKDENDDLILRSYDLVEIALC